MRDQESIGGHFSSSRDDPLSIFIGQFQAVFAKQRFNRRIDSHIRVSQDAHNLRISDGVAGERIEIDLINRATGGEDRDFHGVFRRSVQVIDEERRTGLVEAGLLRCDIDSTGA